MSAGQTYHAAVRMFRLRLIEGALLRTNGNRTYAARALGIQRTYLMRLVRELGVTVPPPSRRGARQLELYPEWRIWPPRKGVNHEPGVSRGVQT